MENERKSPLRSAAGGTLIGAATSVFGGGGGMVAVPLLTLFGLPQRKAHATAILVILPVAALSFFLYAIEGLYDFSVLIPAALGVVLGGLLGAKLLNVLSGKWVSVIFAVLQLFAGVWMIL